MTTAPLIRVLIADKSSIMRRMLTQTLNLESNLEVTDAAKDGAEVMELFRTRKPDAVLLDVDLPKVSGAAVLKAIRELDSSIPVLMFGAFSPADDTARRAAMEAGATDCVAKPPLTGHADAVMVYLRKEVVSRILTSVAHRRLNSAETEARPSTSALAAPQQTSQRRGPVIVFGAATGGPDALAEVISQLPADIGVPILIVQHMPPLFTQMLAERLDKISPLTVREGFDGAVVVPGDVWIAPGDFHMSVARRGTEVILVTDQKPAENSRRPAIDVLFRSVAEVYGGNTLAIVLTGMGDDGTAGCRCLKECGAEILVQDEESSVVWGQPCSVESAGLADAVLSLKDIAPAIMIRLRGFVGSLMNRCQETSDHAKAPVTSR